MGGITAQAQFEQALAGPGIRAITLTGSGEYWVPNHLEDVNKHIKLLDRVKFTPAGFSGTVEAWDHTFVEVHWGSPAIRAWDECKAPRLHVLREANEYGEPICGR